MKSEAVERAIGVLNGREADSTANDSGRSRKSAWESFDEHAEKMARGEISFDEFAAATSKEFLGLARKVSRDKKLPSWWDVGDVAQALKAAAWHNFFVRAGGFKSGMYRSPGAWIRWKAQNRVRKDISRAKGENQHTRRGAGAPEYLSSTGELPDRVVESDVDRLAERSIEVSKLDRLCQTPRELAIVRALARSMGDERVLIARLLKEGFADASEVRRAVDDLVDRFSKRVAREARAA